LIIRGATSRDERFLWDMSYEAAFATVRPRPPRNATRQPQIARYLTGWGRPGDRALVAETGGERVGAAWYRLFPAADPGYGFVDELTPEVSIAVAPDRRGRGVGEALLRALLAAAREDGFEALSLSVAHTNTPARRLYERCGFVVVAAEEDAVTMRAEAAPPRLGSQAGGMTEP
jgi:ribosomal protein S18 acetylase RimI-like enzyme